MLSPMLMFILTWALTHLGVSPDGLRDALNNVASYRNMLCTHQQSADLAMQADQSIEKAACTRGPGRTSRLTGHQSSSNTMHGTYLDQNSGFLTDIMLVHSNQMQPGLKALTIQESLLCRLAACTCYCFCRCVTAEDQHDCYSILLIQKCEETFIQLSMQLNS